MIAMHCLLELDARKPFGAAIPVRTHTIQPRRAALLPISDLHRAGQSPVLVSHRPSFSFPPCTFLSCIQTSTNMTTTRPFSQADLQAKDAADSLNWTRGEFELPSARACGGEGGLSAPTSWPTPAFPLPYPLRQDPSHLPCSLAALLDMPPTDM